MKERSFAELAGDLVCESYTGKIYESEGRTLAECGEKGGFWIGE